jgi:hypothetical protein
MIMPNESLTIERFRQLSLDEQNKQLEIICKRFLENSEFLLLFDIVLDSFNTDESLKGIEMREDRYLKACQREGIEKLKNLLQVYSD